MSNINQTVDFQDGIVELNLAELDAVNGALAPAIPFIVGKAIGYAAAAGAGTAAGVAFTKVVKEAAKALDDAL